MCHFKIIRFSESHGDATQNFLLKTSSKFKKFNFEDPTRDAIDSFNLDSFYQNYVHTHGKFITISHQLFGVWVQINLLILIN